MNPLELNIYRKLIHMGIDPSVYEFCLMVDADTIVLPDALTHFISTMVKDARVLGLCGETLIANEKSSWIAAIQVYEYFISHHLAKNFESMFGSVTCLPGCFCIYRIRTARNKPLLLSPKLIKEYCRRKVDTLHLKNLLLLGEDRYLTTLAMKSFPNMRLCFNAQAKCKTVVPNQWGILLSQRRRWTNSTVHNLIELLRLNELCGFCCFSMRFFVFVDLFSTVVQPAGLLYVAYLCYSLILSADSFPTVSLIMLSCVYGLQVIIFLLRRQWAMIGWMIIYILAMPLYAFAVPLYSFWNMDDFAWGSTRVVAQEIEENDDDDYLFELQKPDDFLSSQKKLEYQETNIPIEKKFGDEKTGTPPPLASLNTSKVEKWLCNQVPNPLSASSSAASTKSSPFASSIPDARLKFSIPLAKTSQNTRNQMPSEALLRTEIKGILASAQDSLSFKDLYGKLEDRFRCDLAAKRESISVIVNELVSKLHQ